TPLPGRRGAPPRPPARGGPPRGPRSAFAGRHGSGTRYRVRSKHPSLLAVQCHPAGSSAATVGTPDRGRVRAPWHTHMHASLSGGGRVESLPSESSKQVTGADGKWSLELTTRWRTSSGRCWCSSG